MAQSIRFLCGCLFLLGFFGYLISSPITASSHHTLTSNTTHQTTVETELAKLSLLADENEELVFDADAAVQAEEISYLCLVGLLLTDKPVNFPAMRNHFANLWAPAMGLSVRELKSSRYLFKFDHMVEMNRVIDEGPWTFANHLLLLHKLGSGENPSVSSIFTAQFWVRVFNLPIGQIGNSIGEFVSYDVKNLNFGSLICV